MKIYKQLEDYLRDELADGKIDFHIRARIGDAHFTGNKDAVHFYIHPQDKDGDTQDYRLEGGQMFVTMPEASPPAGPAVCEEKLECGDNCGHTDIEHRAFDAGFYGQAYLDPTNDPYLREIYQIGKSVKDCRSTPQFKQVRGDGEGKDA